jgi:hypothetical protein
MSQRHRSQAQAVVLGVLAGLLVTILFPPIITKGWCYDTVEGGESWCGSVQTSVVGIESSTWLWGGAVIIVLVATLLSLRRMRGSLSTTEGGCSSPSR